MANKLNIGLSAVATGTADVITATYSPAITLTDRRIVVLRITTPNTTTTPTFNPNGLGAKTITKNNGVALSVGDLQGDCILMYDLANTRWELLMAKVSLVSPDGTHIFEVNDNEINATGNAFLWNNDDVATQPFASSVAQTAEDNAKAYAESLVVGLWDDRGSFSAAGGAYPSTGGSGTAGAIKKGDVWTISVAGTLPTGQVVEVGDLVRALVDTPGNTQANWAITQNNIGYTAENSANKDTDGTLASNSDTKYASQKATKTYADSKVTQTITNGVTDKAPSEDVVYDALALKYRSEQFFTTSNQSVADGGVYIFGQTGAPANVAASASKVPVLAGTVVAVTTEVFSASTIGSTEGGTLKLWYNDGAASLTLATDFQVSANRSFFRAFTGLSTAINDGNCYIEYTAPTLATNPTAIRWMVTVYIR